MFSSILSRFREHYGAKPDVTASAPGRIEFIGNHTDYNGGWVIGAAVDRRLFVSVRAREDNRIRLVSDLDKNPVETTIDSYRNDPLPDWTSYPLGVMHFLLERMPEKPPFGFDLSVYADLASGAGLASSAALELAGALALNGLWNMKLDMDSLVKIAHRAETRYVGVPCGVLDQTVVAFGRKNRLVLVDASDGSHRLLPVPDGTAIWLFETHRSHSLLASPYAARRRECEEAYRILSGLLPGSVSLAWIRPDDLSSCEHALPNPELDRARHVIGEHRRVMAFEEHLKRPGHLRQAGALLSDSHKSSRDRFENSTEELDFVVDTLSTCDAVLGARLSGGGFGGAVLAWTTEEFKEKHATAVASAYLERFKAECALWRTDISDGARLE
ncbi:MAG: galactokinase [Bacteroidetes bacterium]|nr:galactokinase [Bacteroidota bacterium]